jgi:hypothetical protein
MLFDVKVSPGRSQKFASILLSATNAIKGWIHMYHRKLFEQGEIQIEYNGIFMLAEILIRAHRKGYTFYEFEVKQTQRLTWIATSAKPSTLIQSFFDVGLLGLKLIRVY